MTSREQHSVKCMYAREDPDCPACMTSRERKTLDVCPRVQCQGAYTRLEAELAECRSDAQESLLYSLQEARKERDALRAEVEAMRAALQKIAGADYRGNRHPSANIAYQALRGTQND